MSEGAGRRRHRERGRDDPRHLNSLKEMQCGEQLGGEGDACGCCVESGSWRDVAAADVVVGTSRRDT